MNPIKKLYGYYETYHAHGRPLLKYIGIVGALTYVVFYLIRFTRPNPRPFDDIGMRLMVVTLFALLAARDHWPERLRRYYLPYSYAALIICLPFFNVYFSLERNGGIPAMSNCFIALSFLVMLTDWRNTIAMLLIGVGLASAAYFGTHPTGYWPPSLLAQLPAYLVILIGGGAFKLSEKQIDREKARLANALAGSIAHEMRNPLGRIKYNLEKMQHALPPPTTTGRAQALDSAQAEALYRHLAESELAVKRGLQVIAMTLDEVSAKPVDGRGFTDLWAAESTRKALEEYAFANQDEAARVRVDVVEDFSFRGDETAYLFVVFNLLKNALYYLPAYPDARVSITIAQHEVRVHDTGPGMAPGVVERVFLPFVSAGKTDGTGLGLPYCKRVMQAFGGDIDCESVVGQYTKFTLRFPAIAGEESRARHLDAMERARAVFQGKRILVVDDDAALRITTRHKLQPLGAEVDQAADGQRALDALARQHYDLVLLDLNMPVLDGYELTQRVRHGRAPLNRHVPIVAHTSEAGHLAVVKTRKAGIDGFIAKPCGQLQLMQVLQETLERCAARAQPGTLLAGRRIILADDSPQNRKAVAAYLKHAGAVVVEAGHGGAVLEHLREPGPWDAVLLDINMPGMDGLETARAIRAGDGPWRAVPIVALTAYSDDPTVRAAQASGMSEFIIKPVEAPVLYEKLAQLVTGAAPMAAPLRPTLSAVAAGSADTLLHIERLESYARIGMLRELLDDYVPEIAALVTRLEARAQARDLQGCLDALHSLLGMGGEAGAQALYQAVRRVYVPMVETRSWPRDAHWAVQIAAIAGQTVLALKAYGAANSGTPAC